MAKDTTYRVTIPSIVRPSGKKVLWGVEFVDGVATGVRPGKALSSFKDMGYNIAPERQTKAFKPTGDVEHDVAVAIDSVLVTPKPKRPRPSSIVSKPEPAQEAPEDPGEETPLPEA